MFFDDADIYVFIKEFFPEYKSVFDGFKNNIQRIDFFRYLAIYHYGGFYFDLDVFFFKSLEPLRSFQAVFPFEEISINRYLRERCELDWEIGNYGFGCAPKNPLLFKVIENCIRAQNDPLVIRPLLKGIPKLFKSDFEVLCSTGPTMLTRTFAENPSLRNDIHVLFPSNVLDRANWHQFGSYGVHAMEGSWRMKGNYIRRRIANHWESKLRKKMMLSSIQLGKTRNNS